MSDGAPSAPSSLWQLESSLVIGLTGTLSRLFLFGLNRIDVHGLEGFLEVLEQRKNASERSRGLLTVSNHTSVMDDPLMWGGTLPFKFHWNPDNARWGLGSHDVMFKNKLLSTFWSLGQTLPTHRIAHSPHGGLFQPTMTQAIRLLSRAPFKDPQPQKMDEKDIADPFCSAQLTYSTNGHDLFPAPSAYASRKHAWVHIFPEGKIHQKPDMTMRYFKWGVSRLILESEPCPDVVPIWVEGFQHVMHESREFPRFLPRFGKSIDITFGQCVDIEKAFGDLRAKWKELVSRHKEEDAERDSSELGVLPDVLKYGDDAVRIREECTMRVREQVLKLRRQRGWPEEDPKAHLVDTWRAEGSKAEGKMDDGSWVKDA